MKKEQNTSGLRIVDQIRTMHCREYDLACEDGRLTVHVEPAGDAWRVDARGRRASRVGSSPTTASETAPTRLEALRAVAASWKDGAQQHGMTMFDWEAVEKLLVGVRAL